MRQWQQLVCFGYSEIQNLATRSLMSEQVVVEQSRLQPGDQLTRILFFKIISTRNLHLIGFPVDQDCRITINWSSQFSVINILGRQLFRLGIDQDSPFFVQQYNAGVYKLMIEFFLLDQLIEAGFDRNQALQ